MKDIEKIPWWHIKLYWVTFPCERTLQMFTGNCRDFAGKSECRDFKFRGIACIRAIPLILIFPHSDFHYNICRDSIVIFKLIACKVYIFFPLQFLHAYLKWEIMGISDIHVFPITITCLLQGTLCDTGIPCTFYGENICSVPHWNSLYDNM